MKIIGCILLLVIGIGAIGFIAHKKGYLEKTNLVPGKSIMSADEIAKLAAQSRNWYDAMKGDAPNIPSNSPLSNDPRCALLGVISIDSKEPEFNPTGLYGKKYFHKIPGICSEGDALKALQSAVEYRLDESRRLGIYLTLERFHVKPITEKEQKAMVAALEKRTRFIHEEQEKMAKRFDPMNFGPEAEKQQGWQRAPAK